MDNLHPPVEKKSRQSSIRFNLILGNMAITFFAIIGMGLYVYYRAQQSNDYLTTQLDASVYQQAQNQLSAESAKQTQQLNDFFVVIRRDISNLGTTLGQMLSQDSLGASDYWNAADSLSRLPNGSWDNSTSEIASIFIPAAIELTPSLVHELNIARQIDFSIPAFLRSNSDAVALYFGGLSGETIYYPNIDLAAIVPPDFDVTTRPWFVSAAPGENPTRASVWSVPYLDAALNGLVITSSTPVYDSSGVFFGVAAVDIQLTNITRIVTSIRIGQTGYAFLLDKDMRLIAMPDFGYRDLGISPDSLPLGEVLVEDQITTPVSSAFWEKLLDMTTGNGGFGTVSIGSTDRFIVYQPVPEIGYSLVILVPAQELLADAITANEQIAQVTRNTILISIFIIVIILVLALLASLLIGNRLTRPLAILTRIAEEISQGDLNAIAPETSRDEFGTLSHAFNSMTSRLRDVILNLEKRVADRTVDLERRALQIQAAAEVGNAAASIRNLEELLFRVTQLIFQKFSYYHTGIFLLDDRNEFAVMRASNSEGGQKLLARGHKLKVGQVGIVGYVTDTGKARIALDVGEDAVFFDNPDLPETRSEMALPLIIGTRIIGALDVQSKQPNAFTEEDIQTLRVLADQLAIAIENARLFSESQRSIEQTRRAYGDISKQNWDALLAEKMEKAGVTILPSGITVPVTGDPDSEFIKAIQSASPVISTDGITLFAPIMVLGNSIGAIRLERKEKTPWLSEEINAIVSLTDQLGAALESARLYEQISDRARRESLVAEISARIGASVETETIMKTTVEEIGRIFKESEVVIQLKKESGK